MARKSAGAGSVSASAALASKSQPQQQQRRTSNSSMRMLLFLALGAFVSITAGCMLQWMMPVAPTTPTTDAPIAATASRSASSIQTLAAGRYNLACRDAYPTIGQCSPPTSCGRILVDDFLTPAEVEILRAMAARGMQFGNGNGGPTIFDTVSGAASKGAAFINAYAMMNQSYARATAAADKRRLGTSVLSIEPEGPDPASLIFNATHLELYRTTAQRIKTLISKEFGVSDLYLTQPSFFSRITSKAAQTTHDEYTHIHNDRLQYESFMYTALVYLSDHGDEFTGGEFRFHPSAKASASHQVLPRRGRMMAFTSGEENLHSVTQVMSGTRQALTIAFTCDAAKSVETRLFQQAEQLLKQHQNWLDRSRRTVEDGLRQPTPTLTATE